MSEPEQTTERLITLDDLALMEQTAKKIYGGEMLKGYLKAIDHLYCIYERRNSKIDS